MCFIVQTVNIFKKKDRKWTNGKVLLLFRWYTWCFYLFIFLIVSSRSNGCITVWFFLFFFNNTVLATLGSSATVKFMVYLYTNKDIYWKQNHHWSFRFWSRITSVKHAVCKISFTNLTLLLVIILVSVQISIVYLISFQWNTFSLSTL